MIADYLLKQAGLKQVKRMLEAAAKSPEAAKRLHINGANRMLSPQEQISEHLSTINRAISDSKQEATKPSKVLTRMSIDKFHGRTQAGTPLSLTNTEHAQALEGLRQAFGRKGQRAGVGRSLGNVDVFDLGQVRPKDKVGVSQPHTTRDPLTPKDPEGDPNPFYQLAHLPEDPRHPKSHIAKVNQEYRGIKPVANQDLFWRAAIRGGANTDHRFETVVDGSYLQHKKIGEFAQIGEKEAPINLYDSTYHTALTGKPQWVFGRGEKLVRNVGERFDRGNAQSMIKANLSGGVARRDYGVDQPAPLEGLAGATPITAISQMSKSKAVRRFHQSPTRAPEGYTPFHVKQPFQDNVGHYEGSAKWENYPSDHRYVAKGRHPNKPESYTPGTSYWTSQLITAVPPTYASHMDLSKGNLYYKTNNPKAFGKAMNKYLDKPIEGS